MKKITSLFFLFAALLFTSTGCLKDKIYDDQTAGIRINDVKGVAFPQASSSPVIVGITGQSAPLTVAGPFITIESGSYATSNVNITLATDTTLVRAAGLTPLPAGTYTLSTMNPVIQSGKGFDSTLKITITNTHLLNPAISYGIGIRMTSVDGGYTLASNSKTVVIGFNIKNKYDGIYRLQGYHNRTPYTFPYDVTIHMITRGPNSVIYYWPDVRSIGHPIGTGVGATSWYGDAIAPVVVFNTTTNMVTDVFNATPGTPITMFTGAGSGVSRFDETANPKKMYVYWNYNNNPLRAFFDTLTYIGPRP